MNYSDDACMNRFTPEQRNRMRCAIMSYRNVNTAPRARFTHAVAGAAVTFTNTSTDAESPLAIMKSTWTFGDGTTSTDASPTHRYAAAGAYRVTLEVVDPGSGASTVTQAVDVVIAPAAPDGAGDDDGAGGPGEGAGCCQAPGGHASFLLCALPVALVLRRRRRA
jgi:PKD repeat protein